MMVPLQFTALHPMGILLLNLLGMRIFCLLVAEVLVAQSVEEGAVLVVTFM